MRAVSRPMLIGVLAFITLIAAMGSLAIGPAPLSLARMADTLRGADDPIARTILFELRVPRTILALLVGAVLGTAGAALQGYLRNPLAEPSVLGASTAASLGAVIALYFGFAMISPILLPGFAVAGAMIGLVPLFLLAARSESPLTLILAGIAISTLATAGVSLALNLSPNPFAAMEITNWLMGALEDRSFQYVWIALPCISIGMALLLWNGRALDALTLGEDGARALGVDLMRTRLRLLAGVAIGVGGAVAVSGAIGFIGLIVPHLIRPLTDRSPSAVLWPSALGGAALLTLADIMVRLIPTSSQLKLGVVTAFLGVPIFLFHLIKERRLW